MLQQLRSRFCRTCNVMAGDYLQAHLGWTPVFITESGDDGICRSVIPNVEQTTGTPGTHPIVGPTGKIEHQIPWRPSMSGQGSKFLHIPIAICARHQVQTEAKECIDTYAASELLDQLYNTFFAHIRKGRSRGEIVRIPFS
jgi:hypothetical protein